MATRKDDESLFSRIKRFVANPTTDWAELNSRQDAAGLDAQKSEIREMVERKRRNDFVRKRELDMLRRIRREGLGPEQVAALGNLSQIDEAESRPSDPASRADAGVKAKIDAIEQQMVGPGTSTSGVASALARHPSGFFDAPTEPAAFRATPGAGLAASGSGALPPAAPAAVSVRAALPPLSGPGALDPASAPTAPMPLAAPAAPPVEPAAEPAAAAAGDLQHDPELDEAVIAFANADFDQCERAIVALTAATGRRATHVETWLARFDLYRATGQHDKFEALALDYAQRFGLSAPQWYSLPRLVADAVAAQTPRPAVRPPGGAEAEAEPAAPAGWVCPALLDSEALARLRAQSLQMPLPWVLDWSALERVEPDAAAHLSVLLRHWASQPLTMHWRQGERLLAVLAAQSPTGLRDADPAFWVTRLDVLRLANQPDQFDETAIDYCVTYEVSPPSWERARCTLHFTDAAGAAAAAGEASTSFFESSVLDEVDGVGRLAQVDLSGQLLGAIGTTLEQLDAQIGDAHHLQVNCARLIRVDFLAAGDLLNWVLAKRAQGRDVSFVDMHRLVGLFFGAMGINEHARVRARRV
jgi:hypothetical protein